MSAVASLSSASNAVPPFPSVTTSHGKPLAVSPQFPLSPLELARWNRFARKGGIGTARATADKASEDGSELMFIEGDEVVVLMQVGGDRFLGFCEGVVGLFSGNAVAMQQSKLKRPVVSSRSSSSTRPHARGHEPSASITATSQPPPPEPLLPASAAAPPAQIQPPRTLSRAPSLEQLASKPLPSVHPNARRKPVPEVEVLSERFDVAPEPTQGLRERRMQRVAGLGAEEVVVAGLGIAVAKEGGEATRRIAGEGRRRRERVVSGEAQEILSSTSSGSHSPVLAGAFPAPSHSHPLASIASVPHRPYRGDTTSPAPSSADSATTSTPSLITSPFSDASHSDSASSSGAHEGFLHGPFTPESAVLGQGFQQEPYAEYYRSDGRGGEEEYIMGGEEGDDSRDGPTPTVEKFPHPPPSSLNHQRLPFDYPSPAPNELAPTPNSSPNVPQPSTHHSFSSTALARTPSAASAHLPLPAFVPAPRTSPFALSSLPARIPSSAAPGFNAGPFSRPGSLLPQPLDPQQHQTRQPRSAFSSWTPDSSLTGSLQSSVLGNALAEYPREQLEEGRLSLAFRRADEGEGEYEDDPTLAFIFDSYAYDSLSTSTSTPNSQSGTPSRSGSSSRALSEVGVARSTSVSGPVTPVYERAEEEAQEEPDESSSFSPATHFAFGAATQLRQRAQLSPPSPSSSSSSPSATTSSSSASPPKPSRHLSLLDPDLAARIPRMSSIFPRSATDDSLVLGLRTPIDEDDEEEEEEQRRERWPIRGGPFEKEAVATPTRRATLPSPSSSAQRLPTLSSLPNQASTTSSSSPSSPPLSPARRPRQRVESVPILPSSSLALQTDLAASRKLFEAHFAAPPAALVKAAGAGVGVGRSPSKGEKEKGKGRKEKEKEGRRRPIKGLMISAPFPLSADGAGVGATGRGMWRSSNSDSPVKQEMPRPPRRSGDEVLEEEEEGEDDWATAPLSAQSAPATSSSAMPQVSIVGPSPLSARLYGEGPQPQLFPLHNQHPYQGDRHHLDNVSLPHSGSSSPSSFATAPSPAFSSSLPASPLLDFDVSSSPAFSSSTFPTPPSSASYSFSFAPGGTAPPLPPPQSANKLRKQPSHGRELRGMKSSPSLASLASASSLSVAAFDPFSSGSGAGTGEEGKRGLFNGRKSKERERQSPSVDRGKFAGISNKDFEEETVQIGKEEFEMVKPLVVLLGSSSAVSTSADGQEKEDESESLSSEMSSRSPASSSSPHIGVLLTGASATAEDFTTPRRPLAPPTSSAALLPPIAHSAVTPSHPSLAVPTSHFSPATPSSVEEPGGGSLADYRARETKWLTVLSGWTIDEAKKSKKLRTLVGAGVPSSVRGKVWSFLSESEGREGVYQSLLDVDRSSSPALPAIEADLDSLLLDHPQFAYGSAGRDDLSSVLLAFSRYVPHLSHYSGLVNVAALLLTQLPAEAAFWTLTSLVKSYGFKMFFPSGVQELRLETLAFEALVEACEPKIAKKLREWNISASIYLPLWLSTFFLSILPFPTVLRVVDLLLFDPKTRYRAPLALLTLSSPFLLTPSLCPSRDAALKYLLAPPPDLFSAPQALIAAIGASKVTEERVKKAFKAGAKELLKPRKPPPFRGT